jgi:hypothetical protein
MSRAPDFEREMDRLQRRLPDWAEGTFAAARKPGAVWTRVPLAIALMVGGLLGFLPILGFWMLPLGLALLAHDLAFLRDPLARLMAWINGKLSPAPR